MGDLHITLTFIGENFEHGIMLLESFVRSAGSVVMLQATGKFERKTDPTKVRL
jgi:hypothetical protein